MTASALMTAIPGRERIQHLDALRGLALLGILLVNGASL